MRRQPSFPAMKRTLASSAGSALLLSLAGATPLAAAEADRSLSASSKITLQECIATALVNNRDLQIERINLEIARYTLSASYGYYDPIFLGTVRKENRTEAGGFDPIDLSSTPSFDKEEQGATVGLTGFLPSGLNYSVSGLYDHSSGTRSEEVPPGGSITSDFDSYDVDASIFLQQPLLKNFWTDQGRTTIQVNKKNLKITELGVAFVALTVINQVQQAYYDLLLARDSLGVQQRLRDARATFLAGIRRQVEVGTMNIADQRMAEAQTAAVEADLVLASNTVMLAENALKTVLGDPFTNRVETRLVSAEGLVVLPHTFDLHESRQQGLALRPDLAQLRQNVQRAEIDVRFRRNQLFPSLDITGSYGRSGVDVNQVFAPNPAQASVSSALNQIGRGDNPASTIGLVFSLPLSRTAERGNYRASQQMKEQAALWVKQKEELVLREVTDAYDTARTSLGRVTATRQATEAARAALEAEERKMAGGTSDVFIVLQMQGNLASAQAAEVRAKADYNKAVSQLRFAEGSLLYWSKISIERK
jgi:outer membrane protein